MIYTSNYATQGTNPKAVSISRKPPPWYTGEHFPELAPTWDMITAVKLGNIDELEYTKLYLQLLKQNKIDPNIVTQFPEGTMLLCYESPKDFCHRHVLASWVEKHTGVIIPEWKNEDENKKAEQDEMVDSLFEL